MTLSTKGYCEANYTIQCKDVTSGKTGCFLFDTVHWQKTGEFKAISPIQKDLYDFFKWNRENGQPAREGCRIERNGASA